MAVAIYKQQFTAFVWDASALEGNPYTYVEVKTLLDGVTIGGRKVSDTEQVLNLADSNKKLLELVTSGRFDLNKETFTLLHTIIARNEALEWGVLRGEGEQTQYTPNVHLGEAGLYKPLPTLPGAVELNRVFAEGVAHIKTLPPVEGALATFLFGALQQFFFDGNKRTSRHMMNGWLMSHGFRAISIPAARAQEFNEKMVQFYISKEGTEMMQFLLDCQSD
ncbi:Fic family protein [Cedecea colo]|nr:cell filamentation protein Fic [Cedecea colo]